VGTPAPDTLEELTRKVADHERRLSDHAQRFDTAQSHQWKRLWFWLQGWPLTDWNAERRNWRPWRSRGG